MEEKNGIQNAYIGVKKDTVPVKYNSENQEQITDFKTLFKTAKKPKVCNSVIRQDLYDPLNM